MAKNKPKKEGAEELLQILQTRFHQNQKRHEGISWEDVEKGLRVAPEKLKVLQWMEETGGEPDVVLLSSEKNKITFVDCSPETPSGRRSLCFDREGWESRKEHRPAGNVIDTVAEFGVKLLTEEEYRRLQEFGEFDVKTSSWVATPIEIRKLGGALFCDRRYGKVFLYHNGAQSYYASRAFRVLVVV